MKSSGIKKAPKDPTESMTNKAGKFHSDLHPEIDQPCGMSCGYITIIRTHVHDGDFKNGRFSPTNGTFAQYVKKDYLDLGDVHDILFEPCRCPTDVAVACILTCRTHPTAI